MAIVAVSLALVALCPAATALRSASIARSSVLDRLFSNSPIADALSALFFSTVPRRASIGEICWPTYFLVAQPVPRVTNRRAAPRTAADLPMMRALMYYPPRGLDARHGPRSVSILTVQCFQTVTSQKTH